MKEMSEPARTPDQLIVTLRLQRWFAMPPRPYSRERLKAEALRFLISETNGDPESADADECNHTALLGCLEGIEVEVVPKGAERELDWPEYETVFQALMRSSVRGSAP